MKQAVWMTAEEMAHQVFDGATVVLSGSGGGLALLRPTLMLPPTRDKSGWL